MQLVNLWRTSKEYQMVLFLSLVAGIGGFQSGTDTGMISDMFTHLKKSEKASDSQLDSLALTASLAAILGAGLSSWLADLLGRKTTVLVADSVFLMGYTTMAAPSIIAVFVGRFLVGVAVGMIAVVCPVFVAEFVPEDVRGRLNSLNGLCITLGQIFAKLITLGLFEAPGWRWMLGVTSVPAVIQFLLMWKLWETPWWLVLKGKSDEALSVLKKCYPADRADEKFQEIKDSLKTNVSHSDESSNSNILKNVTFRTALIASVTVHLSHLIGTRALTYFGILRESSDAPWMAIVLSLILGILCSVFVDRIGRKNVMIISLISMALIFHSLALISYLPRVPAVQDDALFRNSTCYVPHTSQNCLGCLQENCGFCSAAGNQLQAGACARNEYNNQLLCIENNREWNEKSCPNEWDFITKILLIIYKSVHSVGLATVPSIINSEIFPVQHLSVGSGLGYMSGVAFNLLGAQIFIPMAKNQGSGLMYWANAMCSWVVLTAIGCFVPETSKVALGKARL